MNLNNFETIVESRIVERGFDYYEYDNISQLEQVDKNEFVATVWGSEKYSVFIKLDEQQNIIEHSCNCPYDWGDVCKHKVATFYYLRDGEMYLEPLNMGNAIQRIKTDLNKLNKNEIIEIIVDLSKRDKKIKENILWELGYES